MLRTPTLENHFNLLNLNIFQNPFGNKHNFYVSPCSREVMRYFSNIFRWLVPGRSSCCFKSGYVIGLNHLTDVEIDKINKPYRPLASREYSFGAGVLLTASCLILSFGIGWIVGSSIVVGSFHPFFSGDCFVNRCKFILMAYTHHFPPGYLGHNC